MRLRTDQAPLALLVFVTLALSGCGPRIDTTYGQRQGPGASYSVNGTAVLGEMFEQAGHKVYSWHALSPRLYERADCIVWFPDDFAPPTDDVRAWLEDWLMDKPGRTLVYVGRDFDAAVWYWETIQPQAPSAQAAEVARRLSEARAEYLRDRARTTASKDCDWFTVEDKSRPRKVRTLSGDPAWREGIDPTQLDIEVNGRIIPARSARVLLASEGDALIAREPWDQSQLIVAANGSFLLNLPLVSHEHRKLAGKLIDQVGPPGQTVVFLESGPGGPPILEEDPTLRAPTGLEFLVHAPVVWIFLHFALLGALFCFSRWPIFGVPRELEGEGVSDFGRHIRAVAELLARSRDRTYAMTRLMHYRQTVKRSD